MSAVFMAFAAGCASLPERHEQPSNALRPASDSLLQRVSRASIPAGRETGFRPLQFSGYAMDARLALADAAEHSIDLQYYLLQDDMTGHTLVRALRDAAARGVRVRLLVDDMYTVSSAQMLVELAALPNVSVRLFNPFAAGRASATTRWLLALADFSRLNHRMHNKLYIVDGAFAVAGGRNIADEYFFNSEEGNFLDFDLLVTGQAVPRMEDVFDRYWNSRWTFDIHSIEGQGGDPASMRRRLDERIGDAGAGFPRLDAAAVDVMGYRPLSAELAQPPLKLSYGSVVVLADNPEKVGATTQAAAAGIRTLMSDVVDAMGETRSSLVIKSPYYVPGAVGIEGLRRARARGVDVEVITNTIAATDEPFVGAAYARYRVAMLELGVDLREISSRALKTINPAMREALGNATGRSHAKLVVMDRRVVFVGSMNFDHRSAALNTEFGLLVTSEELAEQVMSVVDWLESAGTYRLRLSKSGTSVEWEMTKDGIRETYSADPELSFGARLKLMLLAPLVPEDLL